MRPGGEAEFAVRQGENQSVGTAERVSAAGRRQIVLRVVRRIQIDVVVQNRRRVFTHGCTCIGRPSNVWTANV